MLKQKSVISIILNVLSSLIGLVSVFFVARYMGPDALGTVNASLAFASLFVIVGDLGFGLAHVKRVSEGVNLTLCIGTFKRIKLVLTIIMAITAVLSLYIVKYVTGSMPVDEGNLDVFFIMLASVLLTNYYNYIPNTFAAKVEKAKEGAVVISNRFFTALFRSIIAVIGLGTIFLAWSTLAGAFLSVILSVFLFKNYPRGKYDSATYKSYKKYAIPSMAVSVTSIILLQLDKVFVAYFSNTTEVGYYTGAQGFISILTFVGSIFISLLLPTYSEMFSKGKIEEIKNLANKIERYISILIMPVGIYIVFFSDLIRQIILGPKFEPSGLILSILSIGAMFTIFAQPYSSQLLAADKIKLSVKIGLWVLIIDIILNLLLIPHELFGIKLLGLGGTGAAISMTIATMLGTFISRYFSFKTTNSKPNYKILLHLVAAIFTFGCLFYFDINRYLHLNSFVYLFVSSSIGILIYIVLIYLVKEFKKEDVKFYLSVINPKLMKTYLTTEFSDVKKKSNPGKNE